MPENGVKAGQPVSQGDILGSVFGSSSSPSDAGQQWQGRVTQCFTQWTQVLRLLNVKTQVLLNSVR